MKREAIEIPSHMVRRLTASECIDKARECQDRLDVCCDEATCRYLKREIRGWIRLARERDTT